MRMRYSFLSLTALLVLLLVTTQAQLFAQYTISTLASGAGNISITGQGVAVDNSNNVYSIASLSGINPSTGQRASFDVVVRASASGLPLAVGSNAFNAPYPGCGNPANNVGFTTLGGITVDNSGDIYIAESGGDELLRVSNGTVQCLLNNQLGAVGFNGVVLDNAGNVYFASPGDHKVYKLAAGAAGPTAVATSGSGGCTNGLLGNLEGMAVDSMGNLYVADSSCNVIWKISPGSSTATAVAGIPQGGTGSNCAPCLGTQVPLINPSGVAVDFNGNLYISDTGNNCIRMVSPDGHINTIAGNGTANFGGDGGPALTAELKQPIGIAVGPGGKVYIGDSGNNRIRVLTPPWAVITSPTPGSVLPGPTVTFTWSAATNGSTYRLDVSDKIGPLGQGDIYWDSAIMGQSEMVGNIPCDGRTIYVRLATLDTNGIPQDPGPYIYHACKTVNMSVTPTTLPQTGGTVDIFIVKGNYYPGSTLTLTKAPYPSPRCFITCPSPTVLGSWTTPSTGNQPFYTFYYDSINVPALPPAYPYAEQFILTATVYSGGVAKDSVSVIVTQY